MSRRTAARADGRLQGHLQLLLSVLPEILAALTFGPLVKNLLGGNLIHAVMAGGVFMLIAAGLAQWVKESPATRPA